jgi:RimJ/RimL family protein N-acetyltransferase
MSFILRDDIVTPRLTLIAITPEMLMSEKNGDGRLGELIQCAVPANWPPEHWEPHVFDFILAQFAEHPEQVGWHYYVCLVPADGQRSLIGALGASSKTATPLECEIGYSILPSHERQGFATEGTKALIEYLRGSAGVESVIAHTFPSLPGSIRVMEKCGLVFDGEGEETGTIRYRLRLRAPQ